MTAAGPRVHDVVVIGGGIAGLTSAHEVRARGRDVLLLEASDRLGGAIHSEARDGYLIEWGPNTVRGGRDGASLLTMARECGLDDQIVSASPAAKRRYIQSPDTGDLVAVAPQKMLVSPLLPLADRAALLAELFVSIPPQREAIADETIAQFVTRRLSRGFADRLIAPMVGGIYAGDIDALSMRAVFPRMVALEQRHGGLIRGALATLAARLRARRRASGGSGTEGEGRNLLPAPERGTEGQDRNLASPAGRGAGGEGHNLPSPPGRGAGGEGRIAQTSTQSSALVSFRDGFNALPEAIAAKLGVDAVRTRCPVEAITWNADTASYTIKTATGEQHQTRHVVVATPTIAAANLLASIDATLEPACIALRAIPYAPVAIVAIGLRRETIAHPLNGFGFLIPPLVGRDVLGCLFTSALFDGRAPDDHVLLTNFVGGALHPHAVELDDDVIVAATLAALKQPLGLRLADGDTPAFAAVHRWLRAIPQYTLGHLDRVATIRRALADSAATRNLALAGNYLTGVSLNDTIANAKAAVAALLGR